MRGSKHKIKNLSGIGVVNTREEEQAEELKNLLEEQGAFVFNFPVIEFIKYPDPVILDRSIDNIDNYDYIIFTSQNGVKFFIERIIDKKKDIRQFASLKIVAIGEKTARKLSDFKLYPDIVPKNYRAEGIIEALNRESIKGKRILIPRAEKAREILPVELRKAGARVDVIPLYRTITKRVSKDKVKSLIKLAKNKKVHCITFTSASTVENFYNIVGKSSFETICQNLVCACIGPITAEKLEKRGINPQIVCTKYTIESLVREISIFFKQRKEPVL